MAGSLLHDLPGDRDEPPGPRAQFAVTETDFAPAQDPPAAAPRAPRDAAEGAAGTAVAAGGLMAADLAGFLAAGAMIVPAGREVGGLPLALSLVAGATGLLLWLAAVYPGYGVYPYELLRRRILTMIRVGGVAAVAAVLFTGSWRRAGLILAFLLVAAPLQWGLRALCRGFLRRAGLWGMRPAILGTPREVAAVRQYFRDNWRLGIRDEPGDGAVHDIHARVALIAGPLPPNEELNRIRRYYPEVILLADIPGIRHSGLRPVDVAGDIGLRLGSDRSRRRAGWGGRAMDIALVAASLPFAAPVIGLAALGIYIVDPGPVFYRQTREGLGGRTFQVLKLRTMYQDADERLAALLATDAAAQDEWARHYKLRRDPRILPVVGTFLRASSIDELPQIVNVLTGDMRIVGPRPFPLYHLEAMDGAFRAKRCTVVPGLTGLWQISARSDADIERQQDLDSFYIDNRSFWLDARIVLDTASAVIKGDGAY